MRASGLATYVSCLYSATIICAAKSKTMDAISASPSHRTQCPQMRPTAKGKTKYKQLTHKYQNAAHTHTNWLIYVDSQWFIWFHRIPCEDDWDMRRRSLECADFMREQIGSCRDCLQCHIYSKKKTIHSVAWQSRKIQFRFSYFDTDSANKSTPSLRRPDECANRHQSLRMATFFKQKFASDIAFIDDWYEWQRRLGDMNRATSKLSAAKLKWCSIWCDRKRTDRKNKQVKRKTNNSEIDNKCR